MNVLLFFTDQQRFDTINALGNKEIKTPNLDRLVREGISFSNTFSPSPMCVPARACMHYGQYPGKTKCLSNSDPMPTDGRESYADILSAAGYDTLGVGKCHFTPDSCALRGFNNRWRQEEAPVAIADDDYVQFILDGPFSNVRDVHGVWREMLYMPQSSQLDEKCHPSAWVADRTMDFIDSHQDGSQPWMAFCSFIHPHPPFAPPYPWDKMYDIDELSDPYMPEDYLQRQPKFKQAQLHSYYMDPPQSNTLWRTVKARYYSCISFLDSQVGRVLDKLEQIGQLDDTMIIFTSDHGEMLGDLGLIGKCNMYEPAAKVPMLVRLPDKENAGSEVSTPITLVDVAATLVKIAGADVPDSYDGEDMLEIMDNPEKFEDRIVFSHAFNPDYGIYMAATDRYRYIFSALDDKLQLFDIIDDPKEDNNLIDSSEHQQIAAKLKDALIAYLRDNDFSEALDASQSDWQHWPEHEVKMQRTESNYPCKWAIEADRAN